MKRTSSLVKRNTGPEADAAEATQQLRSAFASRDVETEASEAAASLIGKRKKPEYQPGKFKAVSQLVLAMNRFKGTLPALSSCTKPSASICSHRPWSTFAFRSRNKPHAYAYLSSVSLTKISESF